MEHDRIRRNAQLGKRLVRLHAWNGWLVLVLAVTGIVLFIPALRGDFGPVRVAMKQAHIVFGLGSAVVLLLYAPAMRKHMKQVRGKRRQQWNLSIVLALLIGWIGSGIVLWQFQRMPPAWTNAALWTHDLLTWIGVPYAIFHAITRSRWLRVKRKEEKAADPGGSSVKQRIGQATGRARDAVYTRRAFLSWSFAGLLALLVGPKFIRWLMSGSGTYQTSLLDSLSDVNRMVPVPEPKPDSLIPLGGGARGQFRVYTITEMPVSNSEEWQFRVDGLVERPMQLNWEQFLKLERKVQVSHFHCVTGWSVYDVTWEGIPLKQLLEASGVQVTAKFVKFYSGDGEYTECLTMEQAMLDDVMIAVLMDGKPIVRDLGGPVRLIVPKMYAYKSIKWLERIELIDAEQIGYWGRRGYDHHAWVPGQKPKPISI